MGPTPSDGTYPFSRGRVSLAAAGEAHQLGKQLVAGLPALTLLVIGGFRILRL